MGNDKMQKVSDSYSKQNNPTSQSFVVIFSIVLAVAMLFILISCTKPYENLQAIDLNGAQTTHPANISISGEICKNPQINNMGQVIFNSCSLTNSNAVTPDQVYFWDPKDGITLVSSLDGVVPSNKNSYSSQLNDFGQVVFDSNASNLPGYYQLSEESGYSQTYFWSLESGTVLVSTPDGSTGCNGHTYSQMLNNSGQVVFSTSATNLPGAVQDGGISQIYLWSLEDGLQIVSSIDGAAGAKSGQEFPQDFIEGSFDSKINGAGQVIFKSDATNLPGANRSDQIYLWNSNGTLTLVTSFDASSSSREPTLYAESSAIQPQLNDMGQVVFMSAAIYDQHVEASKIYQVFVWDPVVGIKLVSSPDGVTGANAHCWGAQINNSSQVVFKSDSSNLPSYNGYVQIYYWDSYGGIRVVSSHDGIIGSSADSDFPQISDAGQVVFESSASNLPGANGYSQIYLWDPTTGITLVSSPDGISGGAGNSTSAQINDLGQIVFESNTSNLPGANGHSQIYLWEYDG